MESNLNVETYSNLDTFELGTELSLCFLNTESTVFPENPRFEMDQTELKEGETPLEPMQSELGNSMVAVHHVTNSSTKTPLLFTGHF